MYITDCFLSTGETSRGAKPFTSLLRGQNKPNQTWLLCDPQASEQSRCTGTESEQAAVLEESDASVCGDHVTIHPLLTARYWLAHHEVNQKPTIKRAINWHDEVLRHFTLKHFGTYQSCEIKALKVTGFCWGKKKAKKTPQPQTNKSSEMQALPLSAVSMYRELLGLRVFALCKPTKKERFQKENKN